LTAFSVFIRFLRRPVSIIASLYCEFLPENQSYARKGFPAFRMRCKTAARPSGRVIPLPVTGGPALSGMIEITRLAIMPA